MKKIKYTLVAVMGFMAVSCGYLDEEPYHYLTEEIALPAEDHYQKPLNDAYQYILSGFNCVNNSFLDCATDIGMSSLSNSNIHKLARGFISADNAIYAPWTSCYRGIRQSLIAQRGLDKYNVFLSGKTEEESAKVMEHCYYEAECLRALYEFTLLQYYGGYPIVDKIYDMSDQGEVNEKARDRFADCVEHIVALCDTAAKYLDPKPFNDNAKIGRMSKGAALAIKAKTLVYAASPLYNRDGNKNPLLGYTEDTVPEDYPTVKDRWKRAAAACADVMNLNTNGTISVSGTKQYTLKSASTDYNNAIFLDNANNTEDIVIKGAEKSNGLENLQLPPTFSKNSGGGSCPTQELVDAFTKTDGTDLIAEDNVAPNYSTRDKRFITLIGYEGTRKYNATKPVYVHTGADATKDALNATKDHSTPTGYYLIKFILPSMSFTAASPTTQFHIWPIIRIADIYLMYAEAMVNAYDDFTVDPEGYGKTALSAVQAVRTRAGFTASTDKFYTDITTPEDFMNKIIKRERMVELCFEGHRYHDLRRWLDAETVLNKPVHGIEIANEGGTMTYHIVEVDKNRSFSEKMYFHPIQKGVLKINRNIEQNPGY